MAAREQLFYFLANIDIYGRSGIIITFRFRRGVVIYFISAFPKSGLGHLPL